VLNTLPVTEMPSVYLIYQRGCFDVALEKKQTLKLCFSWQYIFRYV